MGKQFRSCDLNQAYLLPPSLQDWFPEGYLARFVAEVVEALDLVAIYAKYEAGDGRGLAAYDPRMMVRVLTYGYCRGWRVRGGWSGRRTRMWRSATWRPTNIRTTTRSRRSGRSSWRLWRSSSCRCCSCANGRGW